MLPSALGGNALYGSSAVLAAGPLRRYGGFAGFRPIRVTIDWQKRGKARSACRPPVCS
jgi:hypothetical protein